MPDEATPTYCDCCGKIIEGMYASIGGNIVPYIPAKNYHMGCVPRLVACKQECSLCGASAHELRMTEGTKDNDT